MGGSGYPNPNPNPNANPDLAGRQPKKRGRVCPIARPTKPESATCATKETRTMRGPAEAEWLVVAEESEAASRLVKAKSSTTTTSIRMVTCLGLGVGVGVGLGVGLG